MGTIILAIVLVCLCSYLFPPQFIKGILGFALIVVEVVVVLAIVKWAFAFLFGLA